MVLVTACQPAGTSTAPQHLQLDATSTDIRGEWQLVRLDGRAAAEQAPGKEIPAAIRLVVGDVSFHANSQCVSFAWRYEQTNGKIALTADNPGPMCARGLTIWERDFDRILSAVTDARIDNGMLHLSGRNGELVFAPRLSPN